MFKSGENRVGVSVGERDERGKVNYFGRIERQEEAQHRMTHFDAVTFLDQIVSSQCSSCT